MTTLIGQQLGHYRIEEEIGRGGMARVYRAFDSRLKRHVALKVLAPQLALDSEFLRRFKREAQTAAGLRHQNIVTVFDVGEEGGLHYIAMEYVRGRTLHAIIKERGALGLSYAVGVVAPVASALDYAHAQGAVHRDVKPQNILIDIDGRVFLADFGIAQGPEGSGERLTRTGIFMGTPEYISPEQASAQRVDGRSDLYSLGIATYEMITGMVPFSGATPQLIVAHVQSVPTPPSELDPAQPAELDRVLARALAKRPEQRFSTGATFIEALRIVCRRHGVVPATQAALAELALPQATTVRVAVPAGVTPPGPPRATTPPESPRRWRDVDTAGASEVTRYGSPVPPAAEPSVPTIPANSGTLANEKRPRRGVLPFALGGGLALIVFVLAVAFANGIGRQPSDENSNAIIVGTVSPTVNTTTPTATPLPTNTPSATATPIPPPSPLPPVEQTPVPVDSPTPLPPPPPTFVPPPPTETPTETPTDAAYPPPGDTVEPTSPTVEPGSPTTAPGFTTPPTPTGPLATLGTLEPTAETPAATPAGTAAPAAASTTAPTSTTEPTSTTAPTAEPTAEPTAVPPSATPEPPAAPPAEPTPTP